MKISTLRRIIEQLGMSQAAFARKLGVSQSTLCKWLGGHHHISKAMGIHIRRTVEELRGKGTAA